MPAFNSRIHQPPQILLSNIGTQPVKLPLCTGAFGGSSLGEAPDACLHQTPSCCLEPSNVIHQDPFKFYSYLSLWLPFIKGLPSGHRGNWKLDQQHQEDSPGGGDEETALP